MSWLMVAKMPLLISSRMMSPGLTVNSSASSLTVIVPGSSIAPRSLGSMTCTAPGAKPARRGGLRGPRRPRVPLLLLAMGPSFVVHVQCRRALALVGLGAGGLVCGGGPDPAGSGGEDRREVIRDRCPERMFEGSSPACGVP